MTEREIYKSYTYSRHVCLRAHASQKSVPLDMIPTPLFSLKKYFLFDEFESFNFTKHFRPKKLGKQEINLYTLV
jgi:hypothetical protein